MGPRDDSEEREAADDAAATMEELVPLADSWGAAGSDPVPSLIKEATRSLALYSNPLGPKSELAAARRLIRSFELVQALAILAPRADDGALLKRIPAGEPWLPERPKSVDEVAPFTPENVAAWRKTAADSAQRAVANRLKGPRKQRKPPKPLPEPDQVVVVGNARKRLTLPPFLMYYGDWGKLITLVKTADMSVKTTAGRIAILAYILRVVAETDDQGNIYDSMGAADPAGRGIRGWVPAEKLASLLLVSRTGLVVQVFFKFTDDDLKLIEQLRPGEERKFVVEISALNNLGLYTKLRPGFTGPAEAVKQKKGCQAIEWLKELMAEVPMEYKVLWAIRKIEDDRGVYQENMVPGMQVPVGHFIPTDEASGRTVVFLGGDGSGDLLILTEDGRILAIDEHNRDLQSFCTAILSLAPWVGMFFLVASIAGIIVAGELLPALAGELLTGGARAATAPGMLTGAVRLTEVPRLVEWADTLVASERWESVVNAGLAATTIAIDIKSAGGVTEYVKSLKNPWEAVFLLLNLLAIKSAFKTGDLDGMIKESQALGKEAADIVREDKAAVKLAVAADRDSVAGRGVGEAKAIGAADAAAGRDAATTATADTAKADRATAQGAAQRDVGDTATQNRLGSPEPAPKQDLFVKDELAERRAKKAQAQQPEPPPEPPAAPEVIPAEAQGPIDEVAAMRQKKAQQAQAAAEKAQAEQAQAAIPQKKAVGDIERSPITAGTRQTGGDGGRPVTGAVASTGEVRPAGANWISSVASAAGAAGKAKPATSEMKALEQVKSGLARLAGVTVKLGARRGTTYEEANGLEAVEQLFKGKLSEFPRLAEHWPVERAKQYVAEIQKLMIDRLKRTKLGQEVAIAFQENRVDAALLNQLPADLRADIKAAVVKRWDAIREAFWKNVYDDKELAGELKNIGMTFANRGNAPVLGIGGQDLKITLDHIARKVENPLEAFSADNLRALISRDNSVLKEGLVRNINKLTGLNLDEFQALGPTSERLPPELAEELGRVLDALPSEDDLFRGLGWE